MLRRNIDTKKGLVNGALGTIKAISNSKIKIKFDHVIDPCDIEKVKCSIGQYTGYIVTLRYRLHTGYITKNTVIPILY